MENADILISGAGIAGPALAFWLRRYGFRPTVLERAPAPRSGGNVVHLRGAAREVADRMGITARVREAHTGARGTAFVDGAGRRVATTSTAMSGNPDGPGSDLAVLRTDLAAILYEATRDDVEYVFDDSVDHVRQDADGVEVAFRNGGTRRVDLLVGADGGHSTVRGLVFGAERDLPRDRGCCAALCTIPSPLPLNGWELVHTMPGRGGKPGRTAALMPVPTPGKALAAFFFAADAAELDRGDVAARKRMVVRRFAGESWEVPRMLSAIDDATDFSVDRMGQVELEAWSRGRTVLLGDSAYRTSPTSGIGASLALVGAYVLAGELAAAGGDHDSGFLAYECEMWEFVRRAQRFARASGGGLLPPSRAHMWLRDGAVTLRPFLPGRLVGPGVDAVARTIGLKDYTAALVAGTTRRT